MKKIWVHKAKSFKEAEEFDARYYFSMTPEQRLSDVQFCREQYYKLKGLSSNENRKRLRKVLKITKQK